MYTKKEESDSFKGSKEQDTVSFLTVYTFFGFSIFFVFFVSQFRGSYLHLIGSTLINLNKFVIKCFFKSIYLADCIVGEIVFGNTFNRKTGEVNADCFIFEMKTRINKWPLWSRGGKSGGGGEVGWLGRDDSLSGFGGWWLVVARSDQKNLKKAVRKKGVPEQQVAEQVQQKIGTSPIKASAPKAKKKSCTG